MVKTVITFKEFRHAKKKLVKRGMMQIGHINIIGFFTDNYFYYEQDGFYYYV